MQKTETRIVIGKWYWDPGYDKHLVQDPIAIKLLYAQVSAEVERGWIITTKEIKCRLDNLKLHDEKIKVSNNLLLKKKKKKKF